MQDSDDKSVEQMSLHLAGFPEKKLLKKIVLVVASAVSTLAEQEQRYKQLFCFWSPKILDLEAKNGRFVDHFS